MIALSSSAPLRKIEPKRAFGGLVGVEVELPDDADRRILQTFRYWKDLRRVLGRIPGRDDIDPLDLAGEVWPHLILSELTFDPFGVIYRLVGTAVVEIDGADITGMRLDEAVPRRKIDDALADYEQIAEGYAPHFRRAYLYDPRLRNDIALERLHLPLASKGAAVDKVLTVLVRLGDEHCLAARRMCRAPCRPRETA